MTRNKELVYWMTNKEWYVYDIDKDEFSLTDKAPERAIKSFEMWNRGIDETVATVEQPNEQSA